MTIITKQTSPFNDQKPGTSGLRKKVPVFQQDNYVENFTQAILQVEPKPRCLIVGGDGRYYNDEAIMRIAAVCIGNRVEKLYFAHEGILSTPAASALIVKLDCDGAIILTASHNPGGPRGDLGIKYNCKNGGPAPESFTDQVYANSLKITNYQTVDVVPENLRLGKLGKLKIEQTEIEIIDPIENYVQLMKSIFDFNLLRSLFVDTGSFEGPFNMVIDCMHGVMGPYARRIFVDELCGPSDCVVNANPSIDFNGVHPDPNLVYARELVTKLSCSKLIKFGVAFDGDGDRHMILGEGAFFVTPGDSLAIVADNLHLVEKYKQLYSICGFARSFPTSPAIDRVAAKQNRPCYVTPTGWKFFGNLLDNEAITVCGEESFGVGGDHIREKDGMFSVLIWLTIIADTGLHVAQVVRNHWCKFGRDYFQRYDFEDCDLEACNKMMAKLKQKLESNELIGHEILVRGKVCTISKTGDFSYEDKYDKSVTRNQGLFVEFNTGARLVFRKSGTGSSGATIRIYANDFDLTNTSASPTDFLADLLKYSLQLSQLKEYTGRDEPTVIT